MTALTQAQLAERQKGIGGSDAGRIMAGEWVSLWKEKTNRAEPKDLSGILAVQMGTCTEDLNHRWFERVTGRAVLERSAMFVSDDYPFMRMNADGITTTAKGFRAYWDAKHVGRLDEAAVLRYTPQMTHCCTILGLDWWVLSVFIGNGKHEIVEQPVDVLYQARLIAAEREFWGYVERDEEPEDRTGPAPPPKPQPKRREIRLPAFRASIESIHDAGHGTYFPGDCPECEALRAQWAKEDADLPNWAGEWMKLARDFAGTKTAADKHAITRKAMGDLVPEDVGLVSFGLVRQKRDGRGTTISLDKPEDGGDGGA